VLPTMVRGGATLNFSGQICQAKMTRDYKIFSLARSACVHIAVDVVDKNMLCLQNFTYPQLWIIFRTAADFSSENSIRQRIFWNKNTICDENIRRET
jgi:hypothetical protein